MRKCVHTLLCITMGMFLSFTSNGQITANFTSNTVSGCSPILVQFSDQSVGSVTTWSWNLGNGTLSSLQNPSTTYINPGTYTVTLTVSDGTSSNTQTITNYITVVPTPYVNFVASDSGISCPPKTIQFTDLCNLGVSGSATYFWDFGDGTTSNLANPSHTYTTSGNYSVTLNVTNSSGCSKLFTKANYIHVAPLPVTNFTSTSTNSCTVPLTVTFNNTTTNSTSYFWNFGDGGTSTLANPTHVYNVAGSYNVTLIATSSTGCSDTMIKPAFVNIGNLAASFTSSSLSACTYNPINFTNTTVPGPGNSTWYFGDGTSYAGANATHAYGSPGIYVVKLVINYNNCSDSTTQTITITQSPTPSFTFSPGAGCSVPFTVNFNNTSTGATSYVWFFGDNSTGSSANLSHTYTAAGTYTVALVAVSNNGCSATYVSPTPINLSPATMGISPATYNGCAPSTINFTTSPNTPIPISSYTWNFGDGTIINGNATMSHTYSNPGTYSVIVNFTTGPGCSFQSNASTISIGTPPTAAFTANPTIICPNSTVNFTNNSTGTTSATTYLWLFGDGSTDTTLNPSHVYDSHGIYTVTLIVTNNGCSDTLVIPNMINVLLPRADFYPVLSCVNKKQVTFTDISTGANTWSWDFGDGSTSILQNPTHTYATFGLYSIILTVTNAATGCSSTKQWDLLLFSLTPNFVANDSNICRGQPITFTSSTSPTNLIDSYIWDFGDGSPLLTTTTTTANHTYTTNGIYTVKLIIKDVRSCYDTLTKPSYIHVNGPIANYTGFPTNGCAPLLVNFTDQSSSPIPLASKLWRFGDGTISNLAASTVAHTYGGGTFTATLILNDTNGCTDSLVKQNYITATKPLASFSTLDTIVCPGQSVNFVNLSAGSNLIYNWNFGDGNGTTIASPNHAYTSTGTYTVSLIVTDSTGCIDTLTRVNYIHVGGISVGFNASDTFTICPPLTVNFTNTSTNANNYTWTFGNGNSSSLPNPTTIFTSAGIYTVKLKATSGGGCSDSVTKTITVLGPSGTLSYSPITGCSPLTVLFTSSNSNTQQLTWDLDNGVTQTTTASSFIYTYVQPGTYLPKVLLSDGVSCIVPVIGNDTIKVDAIDADFTFSSSTSLCQSATVQFYDTTLMSVYPVANRTWTFGDGGTSNQHNPTHFYSSPGTYNISLIISTTQGCSDTIIKTITIEPTPVVTANPDQTLCQGQTTSVQLQAYGATTYSWTPAVTLSCNNCSNPVATPTVTTTYIVTGTTANGCSDTGMVTVSFAPIPQVSAGPDQTICSGGFASLLATGANTYVWSPAINLSCISCINPSANPSNNTTYTVVGTDANGCIGTDDVNVIVNQSPTVSAGPNQIICTGGSTTLQASGASNYTWSPATGLSCTNCANPTANPATTTTYTVVGSGGSSNLCSTTATVTITVAPPPVISAGNNQTVCSGTSAQLQASGGVSYAWSPTTNLSCTSCANPLASPSTTTIYTVSGTDVNGCSNTSQVTVLISPLPTISAGPTQNVCSGSATFLQGSGGISYTWSPATGLSCVNCASPVATPTSTTTYTLNGVGANGCTNSSQVTVNVNPQPTISAGSNPSICIGASTQLQATGAIGYSWSPATGLSCSNCANPTASPTSTTTYTVNGSDVNGCTNSSTVTVIVNPLPTISGGPNQNICAGGSTQLLATGGVSYSWSPATGLSCINCANPVATPTSTTTYTVTGTNANGCTNTSQKTVVVNPIPTIITGSNPTICNGSSVQLGVSGASTYTWSPATGLSCTNCASPTATPASTATYTIIGTSASGCSDTAQITVNVTNNPNVTATATNPVICVGNSTSLSASGATTYSWTPSTGLNCTTCANPVATPTSTTTYIVTGVSGNCTDTGIVTIIVNPLPPVSAGANQNICLGTGTQLQASGATNYLWSPATGLSCVNCANPTASITTATTYTVTGTNSNGCINTSQVTIAVNTPPVVSAGNNQTICSGSPVSLSASGAQTYSWSPSTGLSCIFCANPNANPANTTTYSVIGTDGNGCKDTATVTVKVNPLPSVSAGPDKSMCKLNSVQLLASGAQNYIWSPAITLSCSACNNPFATPSTTTTYTVTGTDSNGCVKSDNVVVSIHPQPIINAGADRTICRGENIQLQASGGQSYVWSPATYLSCVTCPNPFAAPIVNYTYTVVGTDANGCSDSDQVSVMVIQMQPVTIGSGDTICEGQSAQLNVSGGDYYTWTPSTGLNFPNISNPVASPSATTIYEVVIKQGICFSDTGKITVVVNPKPTVNAGADQYILAGNTVELFAVATNTDKYLWTPATDLDCDTCNSLHAAPKRTITYTVLATSKYGCKAQDDVTIFVNCDNSLIFMANTFTPNADGNNDRFYPQGKGLSNVKRFRIYSRWGELLYDVQNIPANDEMYGWDGMYKGEQLKPDVFVYILDANCENGEPLHLKGDVSLIR